MILSRRNRHVEPVLLPAYLLCSEETLTQRQKFIKCASHSFSRALFINVSLALEYINISGLDAMEKTEFFLG